MTLHGVLTSFPTAIITHPVKAQGESAIQSLQLDRSVLQDTDIMDWFSFAHHSKHTITEPSPPADAQTTGRNVIFS